MRQIKFLAVALSALCIVSCNDDMDVPAGDGGQITEGFVNVSINLPNEATGGNFKSAASDGTEGNDNFEEGIVDEYKVNNGIIAFFQASANSTDPDKEAQFVKAYLLFNGSEDWNDETANNVTVHRSVVNEAPHPGSGQKMYALVILNPNDLLSVDTDGKLKQQGTTEVSNLASLQTAVDKSVEAMIGSSKNSFFMTNAPISDIASAATNFNPTVTTLVSVTVYDTKEAAENATSDGIAQIYVERAVAKVEVSATDEATKEDDGTITYKVKNETGNNKEGHTVTFKGWKLNVTNKTTKLVRDVRGSEDTPAYSTWAGYWNSKATDKLNRFFGTKSNPFRVYWAIDGNYDDESRDDTYQSEHFHVASSNNASNTWNKFYSDDNTTTVKDYCLENTMAANQMIQGLTTGIILEATYKIADSEDDTNGDLFTMGNSTAVYNTAALLSQLSKILDLQDGQVLTFNRDIQEGGTIDDMSEFTAAFKIGNSALSDEQVKKLMEDSNVKAINFYKGGRTYYYTRPIRHFGDYYTPINGEGVESADNYTDADHLGRYGVVRNNWYEIVINSVSNPGYPEIPEIPVEPENPDDSQYGFVHVDINILAWTLRKQNVDL